MSSFIRLSPFLFSIPFILGALSSARAADKKPKPPPTLQYAHGDISIPAAKADEKILREFSLPKALDYLDKGAQAWTRERECIACHTNGVWLLTRPALTGIAGKPDSEIRDFFVKELGGFQEKAPAALQRKVTPTKIAYLAAGLAEWDAHVTGELSPETRDALRLMFSVQAEDGSWGNIDCWPPHESSNFQSATVAAMAAATAPGWLAENKDDKTLAVALKKMKSYLKDAELPHDYARLLLLWTSTRMPGLISDERKQKLQAMVWKHQHPDGGWSIRDFSTPENWGKGNRAEKLRAEPEFAKPPSDGHMTGLAALVLRDCGTPKDDARIRKATDWLLANQRQSGRWWTRSLNTDKYHFITYSGTCYPVLALAACDALPKKGAE